MNKSKIIEKIKKLFALSKSSNESEAKLALLHANRIMKEYQLTQGDIERGVIAEGERIYSTHNLQRWERDILSFVASVNYCKCAYFKSIGYRDFIFVGRDLNIKICEMMYDYIISHLKKIRTTGKKFRRAKYWNGYVSGFTSGLYYKMRYESLNWCEDISSKEKAIQISNNHDLELISDKLKELGFITTALKEIDLTESGINTGIMDGRNFNLSRQMNDESIKILQIEG